MLLTALRGKSMHARVGVEVLAATLTEGVDITTVEQHVELNDQGIRL